MKIENPNAFSNPQSVYINTKSKEVSYQTLGEKANAGENYEALRATQNQKDYEALGTGQKGNDVAGTTQTPANYYSIQATRAVEDPTYTSLIDEGAYYKL